MVGEQKDPISFLCSLEKKVAVRNKLNPRTRGWQLQLQCTKRKKATKNGLREAEYLIFTSHSAYVATATETVGVKIDGLLPPNFRFHIRIHEIVDKKSLYGRKDFISGKKIII